MRADPVSLITGHRPSGTYSTERVPINIAPEVRKRLSALLYSDHFQGSGVGYSAFIDRACEAAETEIAQAARPPRPGTADGPPVGSCYSQHPVTLRACGLQRGHAGAHAWEETSDAPT